MTDTEMILKEIGTLKNEMNSRFDKIEERLDIIEEEAAITRDATNTALDVLKDLTDELIGRGLYTPTDKKAI